MNEFALSRKTDQLLEELAAIKCDNMPITVVLDNAGYQRGTVVAASAAALKIELLLLPTYSSQP